MHYIGILTAIGACIVHRHASYNVQEKCTVFQWCVLVRRLAYQQPAAMGGSKRPYAIECVDYDLDRSTW